ncbi:hypothetical protein ACFCZV_11180 [Streptomyces hydrogenans]|uniref:hypothetical protein n=1 Tax=Streptomyces hydrogenans TaxID=1873719 RepID=UPI0035E248F0
MSDEPAVATEEETGPEGSGTKNGRAAAEAEKSTDRADGAAEETGREDADAEVEADGAEGADEDAGPEGPEEEGPEDDVREEEGPEEDADGSGGMTPKQARRLRVAAASVLLVVMGVVLVIRLASRTSVLVVGVYGLAMILCGVVIELARNGRTRLGTWLLVGGLAAALAFDWLILP